MSRRLWRCRNPECPQRGGAVLGRLTADDGLVLDPAVRGFRAFFDTRRAVVICPSCEAAREYRGNAVVTALPK
ncbi:MAG: hypothetical protein AVDCRST_MAG70-1310 [uncultured Thermomicrobiales bacterium]|uniref:Uncharacterized protein n=1 Tax=uncultured Thermomicrobiales bacterium TaxID=1645740 RepID=A0A6J4UNR9_9BACT|nr:MAG: hypothetical protein AVDCRST_MAG70-1310 [uncultured Thermomicrobiales bacterium]